MSRLEKHSVITMIRRALNLVDKRLMDHGIRVAALANAMLDLEGVTDIQMRKNLAILALFHDIGAYRTEEIDRMVDFETNTIWEHSIYGYLVFKAFTPLGELAKVILYHHADFGRFQEEPKDIMHYANLLHLADRIDVFWENFQIKDRELLCAALKEKSGTVFDPHNVELFLKAEQECNLLERLDRDIPLEEVLDESTILEDEAKTYLKLLVLSIDFRSHHTVTHTVNTMHISAQIAYRLGLTTEQIKNVYYGAFVHDLGKVGIPLDILEKPGKLTPDEMEIMRGHVEMTREIVEGSVSEKILNIAVRHHEKLNGTGYPLGLTGDSLSTEERIVAVADIVSALCGTRSYKEAYAEDKILFILNDMCENGQLDRRIVKLVEEEFGSIMEETQKYAEPVLEVYDALSREYVVLLEKLGNGDTYES